MALRAGLVALSTKLETGSQRLWFTSVNGYGSASGKERREWGVERKRNDAKHGRGSMNEGVRIGSYEDEEVKKRMKLGRYEVEKIGMDSSNGMIQNEGT